MATYATQDIVLAAALKVQGFALDHIEKSGNKGTFFFKDVDQEVITQFDLRQLTVEPQDFNHAIKSLTTACRRLV